jgi:hypothetical protein
MTVINDECRGDIEDMLAEITVYLRIAGHGADVAQHQATDRKLLHSLIAIRQQLKHIGDLAEELGEALGHILPEPEPRQTPPALSGSAPANRRKRDT